MQHTEHTGDTMNTSTYATQRDLRALNAYRHTDAYLYADRMEEIRNTLIGTEWADEAVGAYLPAFK